MHSAGSTWSCSAASYPGSSGVGWMQSTGHTSTHELSFVPMHGSAITYAIGGGSSGGRDGGFYPAVVSARFPGVRIRSELAHICGQSTGGDVGERDVLQKRPETRAHGYPHLLKGLGGPGVLELLGTPPTHVRKRSVDRPDHVGERDL